MSLSGAVTSRQAGIASVLRPWAAVFFGGAILLQAQDISATASNTPYQAVHNVTTAGSVSISSGGCVAYTAGHQVSLEPGFHAALGSAFHAIIATPLSNQSTLQSGTAGAVFSQQLAAAGGRPGYTWTSTSLPQGFSLSSTGLLSGAPSGGGAFPVSFNIQDSVCQTIPVSLTLSVSLASTTTSFTSSPPATVFGDPITLQASVTPSTSPAPTGFVYFCDGPANSSQPCTASNYVTLTLLGAGGVLSPFNLNTLGAGTHNLRATYGGDASHQQSTSATRTQTVAKATLTVSLSVPQPNGTAYGQPAQVYAYLSPSIAAGTATFSEGSTALKTVNVVNGLAIFASSSLSVGTHTISCHYNGDANNNPIDAPSPASVAITPSVELFDLTHPGASQYLAGDSFLLTLHGYPNAPVDVSLDGTHFTPWQQGTDGSGVLNVTDTWGLQSAGIAFTEYWRSNLVTASPSPLQVSVVSSSQVTVELLDTTTNRSYQGGQISFASGDSFRVMVYGPAGQAVTKSVGGGSFALKDCGGVPGAPTDATGLCKITGPFPAPGTYNETWKVGSTQTIQPLNYTVTGQAPVTLSVTPGPLTSGTVNVLYTSALHATGGTPPYNWTITKGNLPQGLTLTSGTGGINGIPFFSGESDFTVIAKDNAGNASLLTDVSITISDPNLPSVQMTPPPAGIVNTPYSFQLTASGGSGSGYTGWTLTAGSLPAGLTLNSLSGVISGTPTAPTASTFSVTVRDGANNVSAPQSLSLVVTQQQSTVTEYIRIGGRVIAIEHQ